MQFHDYITMKPPSSRGTAEQFIRSLLTTSHDGSKSSSAATARGAIELGWITRNRPFYNVYPIAVDLCKKTSLNMRWGDILFPTRYLLLRFAGGHEPFGIKSVLLRVPSAGEEKSLVAAHSSRMKAVCAMQKIPICGVIETVDESRNWMWMYHKDDIENEVLEDSAMLDPVWKGNREVGSSISDDFEKGYAAGQTGFLIRLLAFIGLLSRGTDLITPAILSKDRAEYDATDDESRKRWLEQRSSRRLGDGFDIGRSLEIERASTPHWRSPHLALFHTGPGRTVPTLKVRSGCVVIPKDMTSVPTGYLGDEKPGEAPREMNLTNRTTVPHWLRMKIMDRDGRRCRCCGKAAEDGVTLEVDHIDPVANGGGNDEQNLWVLCRPCNSGKSNRLLQNIKPIKEGALEHGI